jgi:hypothetical protein
MGGELEQTRTGAVDVTFERSHSTTAFASPHGDNLRAGEDTGRETGRKSSESIVIEPGTHVGNRSRIRCCGGLVMTPVILGRSHLASAALLLGLGVILLFWAPWSARADSKLQTSNVAVDCEPRQQAVVRQTIANGELQVNIQCVNSTQPASYIDEYGRPLLAPATVPVGYGADPRLVPANYVPRSAVRQAPAPRTLSARSPKRSWQKTALIIGGTAGAGAGIGALVGGKKGALIGAALGGGGASIFEAVKRK